MPTPSLARDFFDKILAPGEDNAANIRSLIGSKLEDDWLDAKRAYLDTKQRENDCKENWSKLLGGFANNQGGVVIWGLDARPTNFNGRMIDVINGDFPINDPQLFCSKLMEWRRQATDPPLANVQIRLVLLPNDPNKGFVVCFIPDGPHKPYRSEDAGKSYWLRVGGSTILMPRSVLQSMFYPKSKVIFQLLATLHYEPLTSERFAGGGYAAKLLLRVGLKNVGTATAKNTAVWLKPGNDHALGKLSVNVDYQWVRGSVGEFTEIRVKDASVHPGQSIHSFTSEWKVKEGPETGIRELPPFSEPKLDVTVFSENQEPQLFQPRFDMDELIQSRECKWEGVSEE